VTLYCQLLGIITASAEMRAVFKDGVLLNCSGSAVIDLGNAAADDDGGGGGGGDGDHHDDDDSNDDAGDADSLRSLCIKQTQLLMNQVEDTDMDDAGAVSSAPHYN
jgi:hypothetical protein